MHLKLNIYQDGEIEKTYETDTLHIMFGTVEDFINVVDIEKVQDEKEVAKMVVKGFQYIKPLLKDIFHGVTEEELRRVDIKEVISVFVCLFRFAIDEIAMIQVGKN